MSFLINPTSIRLGQTKFWVNNWVNFKTSSLALNRYQSLCDLIENYLKCKFYFFQQWDLGLFRFWMTKINGVSINCLGTRNERLNIVIPILFYGPMIPLYRLLADTNLGSSPGRFFGKKRTRIRKKGRRKTLRKGLAQGICEFYKAYFSIRPRAMRAIILKGIPEEFEKIFKKHGFFVYGAWLWLFVMRKWYNGIRTIANDITPKVLFLRGMMTPFFTKLGYDYGLEVTRIDIEMFYPVRRFTAQFVITYCIKKVEMGYSPSHIVNYLKKSFKALNTVVAGYRFIIAGRFNRRDRAVYELVSRGFYSMHKYNFKQDYCSGGSLLRNGKCGFKLWVQMH